MIDAITLSALTVAYMLAVVACLWWIARHLTGREPMRDEADFALGDRVQQRSAWHGEPVKRGTVTEVYQAKPNGISNGVTLYAVLWDGGQASQRGYMGVGLEREFTS